MKIRKGILIALLCLSSIYIMSCKNKELTIENDAAACETLNGSWNRITRSESSVLSDPEFIDSEVAKITFLTSTTMTFNTDQTFTIEMRQDLETFLPTVDDCPFTAEQVEENVNRYMKIDGTYVANSELFQLTNKDITVDDGSVYTAEEYAKMDPSVGVKLPNTTWAVDGNVLTITNAVLDEKVEYRKVKLN